MSLQHLEQMSFDISWSKCNTNLEECKGSFTIMAKRRRGLMITIPDRHVRICHLDIDQQQHLIIITEVLLLPHMEITKVTATHLPRQEDTSPNGG
jgi:hypothetical protein